jgi:hypothetical protein
MEGVIRSGKVIETDNKGTLVTIKTDSYSRTQLDKLKDRNLIYVEIEDEDIFKMNVSFWEKDEEDHVNRKMYTIKNDGTGVISVFNCCEDLIHSGKKK